MNMRYTTPLLFGSLINLLGCASLPLGGGAHGQFIGSVETKWLNDGRKMQLLKPFIYIDPYHVEWLAPEGAIVDGASIPQVAWSVIGGPYEGKYRNASVIHDVACDEKTRDWKAVHEAFYNAMLASKVNLATAKIMYTAVYHFGPRWPVKCTFSTASVANIKNASRTSLRIDESSQIEILNTEESKEDPKMTEVTVLVNPPERQIKETDFEKLKTLIKERETSKQGPMSLEEIQNFHL